ncbi:MAG: phosphopyruvate hydratase [Clostridia bacterium]|jgi:enolase|nr:phosphopyruvate hydratase [Clostridia bacterium]MBQ1963231.1 phosphopyruvate hydratase [Clostridia bacterium]MBQ5833936.1 phosphopyruvate hydratase [Clostridia bacterium]
MNKPQIIRCCAREILDSRGNPTVESTVFLSDGTVGVASVPSGASTGIYEACELRDGERRRYGGKGVREAVANVGKIISPALSGVYASEQGEVDRILSDLDGTENKSRLGANAILSVSIAAARAAANWYHVPLYRYLGGASAERLPIPMMNILNGGAHASNNVEIQEFMIVPIGAASFTEALRIGSEIYHSLGRILRNEGHASTVGDEGGFAPDLKDDEEALELICRAIEESGYGTERVKIALDCAAGEWCDESGEYRMPKRGKSFSRHGLIEYLCSLSKKYPILSIEDGLDQRDFDGWSDLTARLGDRIMLVGDDLFVTNVKRLREGIHRNAANAILVKPNQIGTLTETMQVIRTARDAGYSFIPSHRSGETEDTTLADLAVAVSAPYIKAGAPCRSERVAKYNRLLRIEAALGSCSCYGQRKEEKAPQRQPAIIG